MAKEAVCARSVHALEAGPSRKRRAVVAVRLLLPLAVEVYAAGWDQHGRSAGYRRNVEMLDRLAVFRHRDVIAFSNGSRGTQHAIDQARRRGIPVGVVDLEARPR